MTATAPDSSFALEFPACDSSVREVLRKVRQQLKARGYDSDSCGTVEVVLAEALNNIVEHAYAGRDGGRVSLQIAHGQDRLSFSLHDCGQPLPGLGLPARSLPRSDVPLADLPEGGFGWYLIHTLTSALIYSREGCENRLSFEIETTPGTSS